MTKLDNLIQHSQQSLMYAYERHPDAVFIPMQTFAGKDFELAAQAMSHNHQTAAVVYKHR